MQRKTQKEVESQGGNYNEAKALCYSRVASRRHVSGCINLPSSHISGFEVSDMFSTRALEVRICVNVLF